MSRATPEDLPALLQLLTGSGLPVDDLDDPQANVQLFVARDTQGLAGVVGLQLAGDRGLLRSLVVAPERRGQGWGRALVTEAERAALREKLHELVLLTETAAPFFEHLGYRAADRGGMPAAVQATRSFASLCPATARCLSKPLELAIYHNGNCGTSRNVLQILRQASLEPRIIEYLRTPPDRQTLLHLLQRMEMRPRELLREKGTPYAELGLDDPALSDDTLIDHMLAQPILINRPIVVAPWGVKLCRPSETAREFLGLA